MVVTDPSIRLVSRSPASLSAALMDDFHNCLQITCEPIHVFFRQSVGFIAISDLGFQMESMGLDAPLALAGWRASTVDGFRVFGVHLV